jgi:hypothetical protein
MSDDGDESMASDHESLPGHATVTTPPESKRSCRMDRRSEAAEAQVSLSGVLTLSSRETHSPLIERGQPGWQCSNQSYGNQFENGSQRSED